MSGPLCTQEDRHARTPVDHHRQAQDRLGSMDRADDGRRGHKTGMVENVHWTIAYLFTIVCNLQQFCKTPINKSDLGFNNLKTGGGCFSVVAVQDAAVAQQCGGFFTEFWC